MSTVKFLYGNSQVLQDRLYDEGAIMFSTDSSQIYINLTVGGFASRLVFSGIQYLSTQASRQQLIPTDIKDSLYFVKETCKIYYFYADQWRDLFDTSTSSTIINITTLQRSSLTQCNEEKLYYDTDQHSLYYGINISGDVLWYNLNPISDYVGQVNLRRLQNGNSYNIISNDGNDVIVGNNDGQLRLNGTLSYNGKLLNTPNSLVVLDSYGKISQHLLPSGIGSSNSTYKDVFFQEKNISMNDIIENNYQVLFTYSELNLQVGQTTLIQLLDNEGLIRDDLIPMYWEAEGLYLNFSPIQQLFTGQQYFILKYLVAQEYDSQQLSNTATIATISFDPTESNNNIKSFDWNSLGIQSSTMVQLLDNEGLIRDDVVPVYWTSNGLELNFSSISSLLQANTQWKILYMVNGTSSYATKAYVDNKIGQIQELLDVILGENTNS